MRYDCRACSMNRPHLETEQQHTYEPRNITPHSDRACTTDPETCAGSDAAPTPGGNPPRDTEACHTADSSGFAEHSTGGRALRPPARLGADSGCDTAFGA